MPGFGFLEEYKWNTTKSTSAITQTEKSTLYSTSYTTTWQTTTQRDTTVQTQKATASSWQTDVQTQKSTSKSTTTVWSTSHNTTTTYNTSSSTTTTYQTSQNTTTTYLTSWQTDVVTQKNTSQNTTTTWERSRLTEKNTTTTWLTTKNTTTTYNTSHTTTTSWQVLTEWQTLVATSYSKNTTTTFNTQTTRTTATNTTWQTTVTTFYNTTVLTSGQVSTSVQTQKDTTKSTSHNTTTTYATSTSKNTTTTYTKSTSHTTSWTYNAWQTTTTYATSTSHSTVTKYNTTKNTTTTYATLYNTTTTWETAAPSSDQYLHLDGTNDSARFMDTDATAPQHNMWDSGGTWAMLFKMYGSTTHSNQYIWQNGYGGGWNNIIWAYPIDGEDYNIRFRQFWSSSKGEWSSGYICDMSEWLLLMITYDNGSTSNDATFHYRCSSDGTVTTVSSPTEDFTPSGSLRAMTAHYAAIGDTKNGNQLRPFKGKVAGFACWDTILSSTDRASVFDTFGGSGYQDWSDIDSTNNIFFHNFDSSYVSGTTVSPVSGGSDFNLTLVNGATFSSTGMPW